MIYDIYLLCTNIHAVSGTGKAFLIFYLSQQDQLIGKTGKSQKNHSKIVLWIKRYCYCCIIHFDAILK